MVRLTEYLHAEPEAQSGRYRRDRQAGRIAKLSWCVSRMCHGSLQRRPVMLQGGEYLDRRKSVPRRHLREMLETVAKCPRGLLIRLSWVQVHPRGRCPETQHCRGREPRFARFVSRSLRLLVRTSGATPSFGWLRERERRRLRSLGVTP